MNREFKGIWFSKEVWLDERLSALEKIILLEIDSLDSEEEHCYASNEYLAEFCQCSERKISEAINKLINLDYISLLKFDGRQRLLKSNLSRQSSKKCDSQKSDGRVAKNATNNTNIEYNDNIININNNINIKKENIEKEKEIFDFWQKQKIKIHHELNDKILKEIKKALKVYDAELIKTCITRYAEIYHCKNYYFDTQWGLDEFLKQKNAMPTFADDGSKWVNYLNWKKKPISSSTARYSSQQVTEEDLEKIRENSIILR